MDGGHHRGDVVRVDAGPDAVSKIEDVPRAAAVILQHARDVRADRFGRLEQRRRVEVAL